MVEPFTLSSSIPRNPALIFAASRVPSPTPTVPKRATERKHLPLKDVAAVGGWTDTETLLNCYQQADPGTMQAVVSEPTKVRELVAQR